MSDIEFPATTINKHSDHSYEKALEKKQFFNRISDQYSEHARKLVSLKYFRHMRNELKRFNEFYEEILESIENKDFDIVYYDTKFNKMIEDDIEVMNSL